MCRERTGSGNICNKQGTFSVTLQEDQTPVAAGLVTLPALGLGGRCTRGHKMECFFSLKWNLSSFLSRGVIKISFLLLASPNCFIWHSDEKCWNLNIT